MLQPVANVTVRPPVAEDIYTLVANLRMCDRLELEASYGIDLAEGIRRALRVSQHLHTVEVGGQLAFIGGLAIVSLLGSEASPWLLGTAMLDRRPGALTRVSREYIDAWKKQYSVLFNYVDARNTKSQRWLRHLGFEVSAEPVPYGVQQLPFFRFEMRNQYV